MRENGKLKPLISVVIPAYNEERYLLACLDSLKKQNFKGEYEIIIVDNNSDDNTKNIAENEKGVKVFCQSQRGVCAARQTGTLEANGKIIVSTDADCVFFPDWLSNIYNIFENNKDIVAVIGPYEYVSSPLWGKILIKAVNGITALIYRLKNKVIYTPASNFAFKKEIWQEVRGYNTDLTQSGDEYYLLNKLRKKGKVVYLKNNKVLTSSRRLQRGLIYNVFITFGFYYFFDYFIASRIGHSITGPYPAFREEKIKKK